MREGSRYIPCDESNLTRADVLKRLRGITEGDPRYLPTPYVDPVWTSLLNQTDLLKRHAETYREAIEAQRELRKRIDLDKILVNIWGVWGEKGDIRPTEEGGLVSYSYLSPVKHMVTSATHHLPGPRVGPEPSAGYTTYSTGWNGKWIARHLVVKQEVGVYFGNSRFNRPDTLWSEEVNPFFADVYKKGMGRTDYRFDQLPETIWRRSDNLGVYVTIPYAIVPSKGDPDKYACTTKEVEWFADKILHGWFIEHAISHQEIMDFLEQKFEAQRQTGQLPTQQEALEMAKIEELRKRGLLEDGVVLTNDYYGYNRS